MTQEQLIEENKKIIEKLEKKISVNEKKYTLLQRVPPLMLTIF